MRLDKYLGQSGVATRSEATKMIRSRRVCVDGAVVRDPAVHIDPATASVTLDGQAVLWREFTYVMLNKPEGYVSATEDGREKTVLDLLNDEERKKDLFPCGRLDKNTLGLIILTNDGDSAHRLLSPKHHVSKVYRFGVKSPLSDKDVSSLEEGVDIGEYITKPCKLKLYDDRMSGEITLTEGKYHQIKRMLEAVDNKIVYLERIAFGGIALDNKLERGEWRHLTEGEERLLLSEK